MKYVMFQTTEGGKVPIIFPDWIAHSSVIEAMTNIGAFVDIEPIRAGFVGFGLNVITHGDSESTGLSSSHSDAAYIALGDAVSYLPDETVVGMVDKMRLIET